MRPFSKARLVKIDVARIVFNQQDDLLFHVCSPQGEIKAGSVTGPGFRPNPATMTMDDPLHGGQADASAGKFGLAVETLEGSEERARVRHIETHAVIANHERRLPVVFGGFERNARFRTRAGELHSVVQQVGESNFQQARISFALKSGSNNEIDGAAGICFLQPGGDGLGERGNVDGGGNHFRPADARQVQEVVDKPTHALRFGTNAVKILVPLRVQTLAAIFPQRQAPSVDAAQGSTQVVGYGVGKGFQFVIGRFQCRRARAHPLRVRC